VQRRCLVEIDQVFAFLIGYTVTVVGAVEASVERAEASSVLAELVLPEFVVWLVLSNPISVMWDVSHGTQSRAASQTLTCSSTLEDRTFQSIPGQEWKYLLPDRIEVGLRSRKFALRQRSPYSKVGDELAVVSLVRRRTRIVPKRATRQRNP
jgi:hypothetical protein